MTIRNLKTLVVARHILLAISLTSTGSPAKAQKVQLDDDSVLRQSVLSDLQTLYARSQRLDKPIAKALAEAEIADAAWMLDRSWSKTLLRQAYERTLSESAESPKTQKSPVGTQRQITGSLENARLSVRRRVLQVARRDPQLAGELVKSGVEQLGSYAGHVEYASLAREALVENDNEAAAQYIIKAIESDPTQMGVLSAIQQLASADRAAADSLILQYIQMLSATQLSYGNGSVERVRIVLGRLIYPPPTSTGAVVQGPGPAVMRAYVTYVLNTIGQLELLYPGSLANSRVLLLQTYPLLQRYAPELTQQFLSLEQQSRRQGESFSLPTSTSLDEDSRAKYNRRVDAALEDEEPGEGLIRVVISHGDFAKARKMIFKLRDESQKARLTELLNAEQAISMVKNGELEEAKVLARSLAKATSMLRVFPLLVKSCVARKDDGCAREIIDEAVNLLKKSDLSPDVPIPGLPADIAGNKRENDSVLAGLESLSLAVIAVKDDLAFDVLNELVKAANHSELDTASGLTGFDSSLFKKFAQRNEGRTISAAVQLQDPLRQIVALAAIDQWKSDQLTVDVRRKNK